MDGSIKVLCVGGAGRLGGMIDRELAKRRVRVRAMVRTETQARAARANGASEIVYADLRVAGSLDIAAKGVDGVFHVGPASASDEAEVGLLRAVHTHIAQYGIAGNSLTLRAIVGRPGRAVRQYVCELWQETFARAQGDIKAAIRCYSIESS